MSQFISLERAVAMTTLYRQEKNSILAVTYKDENLLPICETFDRSYFDTVLGQTGCVGLRVYYGMNEDLTVHAIVVGVNSSDEDMISPHTDLSKIIEESRRCPYDCPPASDLNS